MCLSEHDRIIDLTIAQKGPTLGTWGRLLNTERVEEILPHFTTIPDSRQLIAICFYTRLAVTASGTRDRGCPRDAIHASIQKRGGHPYGSDPRFISPPPSPAP